MVKVQLLFLFILCCFTSIGQKIKAFGKIDLDDLLLQNCSYEEAAPAEVLVDEGETKFEWGKNNFFSMYTVYRVRIKIYNEQGLDYANVKINYLNDDHYEKINDISAHTFNLVQGKIIKTKVEKKLIYNEKIDDNTAQVIFTFPEVKIGSVIEYKYTSYKESFSNIAVWNFQGSLPVRHSGYSIQVPEYFRFTSKILNTNPIKKTQKDELAVISVKGATLRMGTTNYNYVSEKLASLKEEPFMGSLKDYRQRIQFQLSEIILPNESFTYTTSWEELAKELRKEPMFGEQLKKHIDIPELDILMQLAKNNTEKIKTIYSFFKKNYSWNGINDFYCRNVKKIAVEKTGTSGDLNLLFLAKLKEYKIEAYPILLSTNENGTVNTYYPFLKQFNSVQAYIPNGSSYYIINAADKYNFTNLIPSSNINNNGLKILKDTCEWLYLNNEKMIEKQIVSYTAEINDQAELTGSTYIVSSGYAKSNLIRTLAENETKTITKLYDNTPHQISIKKNIIKNEKNDSLPIEQEIKFTTSLIKNNDYYFLYYNLFTSLPKSNPFTANNRNYDIDFDYGKQYNITAYITYPTDFELEALPKSIKMIMPDTGITFTRTFNNDDHTIGINLSIKIDRLTYFAIDYDFVKNYFSKLYELLEEPLVFIKKKK
jgi:Domain of Unknown Function with PDB structure (DUF3857)